MDIIYKIDKISLLKNFDKIIGTPLIFMLSRVPEKQEISSSTVKKFLLIRPGGIGDAVLLLPSIRALKEKFPDAVIDILCEKRNADIFKLSNDINAIYLYDRRLDLIKALRNKYDVVVDTEQWHRLSAVAAYLSKSPIRIGFDTNERGKLFTHRIPYSHDDYEVCSFLNLIKPVIENIPAFEGDKPFINVSDDFSSHLLPVSVKGNKIVAIFPGASVVERRWGGDNFGKVAEVLSNKGYEIVILGAASDRSDVDMIKRYANACIDLSGKTSLAGVASILTRCRLLITADSGLMHIAFAVGTTTVSLFGSGIEKKWAPGGGKHIVLNKHLDCSPCTKFGYTPRCRRGVECLSLISVEEVVEAAKAILGKTEE